MGMTTEARPKDPEPVARPAPAFHWFAYVVPNGGISRAVCGSLGLLVVRPALKDAIDELLDLMDDYVRETWQPGMDADVVKRRLPSEAWDEHIGQYCDAQKFFYGKQGTHWDCGEFGLSETP